MGSLKHAATRAQSRPGLFDLAKLAQLDEKQRATFRQVLKDIFPNMPERSSPDTTRVIDALTRNASVPIKIEENDETLRNGGGYYFDDPKIEVHPYLATTPSTLSHEIGHSLVAKEPYGKYLQNRPARVANLLSMMGAMGVGAASGYLGKSPLRYLAAPATAALMSAPVLADEYLAWKKGRKALEEAGGTPEHIQQLDKARKRALTTYLMLPTAATLAGLLYTGMGHGMQHLAKHAATRATLDAYGLSKLSGEDLGLVARGRTPFKPLDPAMQRLRDAQGVNMAFEDNAQIDPTNPNPEPGMIHRADA